VALMTRLPEHRERLKRTEGHITITGSRFFVGTRPGIGPSPIARAVIAQLLCSVPWWSYANLNQHMVSVGVFFK
jgi:hypothetical protein